MKFAHMADCHIGSWQRTPKLADASIVAFAKAMDICVAEKVDFILISGDLFDTSLPAIDKLKETVSVLKEIKDRGIPVYVIAGSHDFSPTGKTMLDVLEEAGLFRNVFGEIVVDPKTGAKITGMLGKKGGLEKTGYSELPIEELEKEEGFKIFMFHSGITEYMPNNLMDSIPLSSFPKNFSYYAGGHIHQVSEHNEEGYGKIVFPGPIFPNNFEELENLGNGGFYIVETEKEIKPTYVPIALYKFQSLKMDCTAKTPGQIERELCETAKAGEFSNAIVGLRLHGNVIGGKTTDINLKDAFDALYGKRCHCILKNTSRLTSEFFEEAKVEQGTVEDVEEATIRKHLGQIKFFDEITELEVTKALFKVLSKEKEEGEKQADFERRIIGEAENILHL